MVVVDAAGQRDPVARTELGDAALERVALVALAHDHGAQIGAPKLDVGQRVDQRTEALDRHQPADRDDERRRASGRRRA